MINHHSRPAIIVQNDLCHPWNSARHLHDLETTPTIVRGGKGPILGSMLQKLLIGVIWWPYLDDRTLDCVQEIPTSRDLSLDLGVLDHVSLALAP